MTRYCHRMAHVIFAQLLGCTVFITVSLVWPGFASLSWGAASPSYLLAVFLAATAGWQWAHGHECLPAGGRR